MELEVSYDEICCEDGQVERRTGAPDYTDGKGEAVCKDCVDRHTFFITPLMVCLERQIALAPTMSPASPTATANQDSYGGVAGQKIILLKHPEQLLAPVAGLRSTERLWHRREEQALEGRQEGSWRFVRRPRTPGAL